MVTNLKNYKSRLYVGAATSVVSLCLIGTGASESRAQSTESRVLPPVSVDAPQQRTRVTAPVRSRGTAQRSARVTPRQSTERPPAPTAPPTMGTTRTIGAPAPAYAGGQVAQGGTLGLLGSQSVMNMPFSTVNYTSQLIENQQARTAADTLINDASVRATTGQNGFDDTLLDPRLRRPSGDVGLNGLYGLVSSTACPPRSSSGSNCSRGRGRSSTASPRRQRRRWRQHRQQARDRRPIFRA